MMDLRGFLRILAAKAEWVVASIAGGAICAMAVAFLTPPQFIAVSEMFLATPGYSAVGAYSTEDSSPYQADGFSQQRARTYVKLATRVDLARRVIDKLGIDMRPDDLARSVSASVQPDTVLIDVSVKSTDPMAAKVLADAVIAELADDIRTLETPAGMRISSVDPVITESAEVPTQASEPKIWVLLALGLSVGALLGISLAALCTRSGVVNGKEGVIASTGRLPLAIGSRVARRLELELQGMTRPVIGVFPVDRCSDSFEVAQELARSLGRANQRVALISLRGRDDVEVRGHGSSHGLTSLIAGELKTRDAFGPDQGAGVYLLAGSEDFDLRSVRGQQFRDAIEKIRASFDWVVLAELPVPTHLPPSAVDGVVDGAVLTMTDGVTSHHDVVAAVAALRRRSIPLLGSVLRASRSTTRSSITGTPMVYQGGLTSETA
ncbi:hypothetical protein BH11ACT7_BH11ACT7_02390 [soil metagenome]